MGNSSKGIPEKQPIYAIYKKHFLIPVSIFIQSNYYQLPDDNISKASLLPVTFKRSLI